MGRHLVLIGGGHAHAGILAGMRNYVQAGHTVTLVNPSRLHYYSGMGPGVLGGDYTPQQISFPVADMTEAAGGTFIEDRVIRIDPTAKAVHLASGSSVDYDVLSLNVGSGIPRPGGTESDGPGTDDDVYSVKPIERLWMARERLLEKLKNGPVRIAVAGGGPAALEVAGNAWSLGLVSPNNPIITIYAGQHFMGRFPQKLENMARTQLSHRGVTINEDGYINQLAPGRLTLDDGSEHPADFIFVALGVRPPSLIEQSGIPVGPDGGMTVNAHLQSIAYPEIFGGGDCIHFKDKPLDKVGVYAVRQHPVLEHNLLAALEDRPLRDFDPGPPYLLIFNLGAGQGILVKWGIMFGGSLAFKIKDYIDRKFMRIFHPDK